MLAAGEHEETIRPYSVDKSGPKTSSKKKNG